MNDDNGELACLNGDKGKGVAKDAGDGVRMNGEFEKFGKVKLIVPSFTPGTVRDVLKTLGGREYDSLYEITFNPKSQTKNHMKSGIASSTEKKTKDTKISELQAQLEAERLSREKAELEAQKLAQATATQPVTVATSSSVSVTNTATEQTVRLSASASKWQNASSPQEAQAFANDIQASIVMFMAIAEVIEKQPPTLKDRVLGIVTSEIKRLQSEKELLQAQLTNRFSTPIRPTNANLSVSAFRAADTFPKIPFYVPGTNEIGEMLVIPRITDDGYLQYQFDFLDPTATYDKVRDSISMEHKNVDLMIGGLQKVDEWTLVAQENGVTRRVEKTSACIPDGACENKVQGVSSTEVVFQIYEDGSTAGRIQRNKGQFSTGYNMSVESSILLSAYLTYMRDVGSKEFNIGVMTDDEVKDLFQ